MTQTNRLTIRAAKDSDVDAICELAVRVYPKLGSYKPSMIRGQINNYPDGHFVATYGDKIVGYSASIILSESKVFDHHTWTEITGGGYGSTHDPDGDILYGYEVFVDPSVRGKRIGQRMYNERKKLVEFERLKGIVFAGRIPGYLRKKKQGLTAEDYVEKVKNNEIRDTFLTFQLKNGFEVKSIIPDYLPADSESGGYAVLLYWQNPSFISQSKGTQEPMGRLPGSIRVSVVQYQQRKINNFDELKRIVSYFVDTVSNYQCDFVLFPELFTLQLLSIENNDLKPHEAINKLTEYTEPLIKFFQGLSIRYNINIIAGSHPEKIDGQIYNMAHVFLRDGSVHRQPKIHPTPNESYWWNIKGGSSLNAIQTDCGVIGVLVCYDSEFPELSRHLIDQGTQIIFIPFLTDEKQSYNRVRYSAHARAIENQCYVAMAGNVGNLPRVTNMEVHYAQSFILTPCDFQFARDGIAADTTPNVETIAIADIQLELLQEARVSGTVQNLKNRRHDLYQIKWLGQ